MRTAFVVVLLLVTIPWAIIGCAKPESKDAAVQAEAPEPTSTEPPAGTTGPAEAGDAAGYEGTWAMVLSTIVLEADGTGRMDSTFGEGQGGPVTWREEGDHVVISAQGTEMTAQLTPDGGCLTLSPGEGPIPMPLVCIRADAAVAEQMATATELNAPTFERAKAKAKQTSCLSNLKQLSLALLMYSTDYDEQYPRPGAKWNEVTYPYVRNEAIYQCPSDPEKPSYQFNPELAGLPLDAVKQPAWTVGLFESDDGKNVAFRHDGGANYGFGDGHAKWYKQGAPNLDDLIWKPQKPR